MPDEIEVEAVLEECRALIKQIVANLSGEKPFADETSATELLSYLERAASALNSAPKDTNLDEAPISGGVSAP